MAAGGFVAIPTVLFVVAVLHGDRWRMTDGYFYAIVCDGKTIEHGRVLSPALIVSRFTRLEKSHPLKQFTLQTNCWDIVNQINEGGE